MDAACFGGSPSMCRWVSPDEGRYEVMIVMWAAAATCASAGNNWCALHRWGQSHHMHMRVR